MTTLEDDFLDDLDDLSEGEDDTKNINNELNQQTDQLSTSTTSPLTGDFGVVPHNLLKTSTYTTHIEAVKNILASPPPLPATALLPTTKYLPLITEEVRKERGLKDGRIENDERRQRAVAVYLPSASPFLPLKT